MKKLYFILIFTSIIISTEAQSVFIADSGEVTFYSYAPIEDIKATSKQVNSFFNVTTGEFAFMIPIRSFHFAKALMEVHFNEKYMESDKFPQATFKGTVSEKIDMTKAGTIHLTAKGVMSIHGIEKNVTEKGEMLIEDNKLTLTTDFFVPLADHNIVKPQLVFKNIADTIEVKLKAIYVPYKKK